MLCLVNTSSYPLKGVIAEQWRFDQITLNIHQSKRVELVDNDILSEQ